MNIVSHGAVHNHGSFLNLTICDHPLLQHYLSKMRANTTADTEFAHLLDMVAPFLAYEALRGSLSIEYHMIDTPVSETKAPFLMEKDVTLVSILGAGQGFARIRELLPWATLGYIGVRRDEKTLEPKLGYNRLPEQEQLARSLVLVLDPMLATGGSSSATITLLKQKGARRLQLVTLISAPEGVEKMLKDHPDVKVLTLALDEKLNERGFIVPGLGDAGDRYHGIRPVKTE